MNYLIQRWRQWRCHHNFKYSMRISHEGEVLRVWECKKCFALKYEPDDGEEFKDLGSDHGKNK